MFRRRAFADHRTLRQPRQGQGRLRHRLVAWTADAAPCGRIGCSAPVGCGSCRARPLTLLPTSDARVSVAMPDGRVEIFRHDRVANVEPRLAGFTNVTGYQPRAGTLGKLEALGNNSLLIVSGGAEDELVNELLTQHLLAQALSLHNARRHANRDQSDRGGEEGHGSERQRGDVSPRSISFRRPQHGVPRAMRKSESLRLRISLEMSRLTLRRQRRSCFAY